MGSELGILLIEDNPGDARLIEEMLRDATELVERVDAGAVATDGVRIHTEAYLEDGLARLADADVVLLDLGLPDSRGLDTLTAVTDADVSVPVVVLTGLDDQQTGVEAIQSGAQDYLVKDEVTSNLLVRTVHHAIERHHQERERERRREELEALNRLNRIGQDVTHAVITSSTREELERAVCERLVAEDAYRFAWVGDVDSATDTVTARVSSGTEEGYLESVTITADHDDETGQGPAGEAIRTHEVQVMQDVRNDPQFEPWREEALERGYRSVAAVPVVYEDVLYGVLVIYATSPTSFSGPEAEILSRLGDVIGHAITAIERKDALVSDTVVQLEFRANDLMVDLVDLVTDHDGRLDFENLVRADDALIVYGRATGVPADAFRQAVDETETLDDLRVISDHDEYEFELVVRALQPLVQAVATHGGRLRSASVADGEFRFVVEFPAGGDKRKLVSLVTDQCPSATLHAHRTVDHRDRSIDDAYGMFEERLTDKQQTAIETAYYAGMFDWPRKTTGEEVADRLGVTPATFSQHLRAAERKFFESVFEDGTGDSSADR